MFNDLDDPRKQMLLAMGLGLLGSQSKRGFGGFANDLSRAGLLGMNAYGQAQSSKDKRAEEEQQRQMRKMQIEQMQSQMGRQNQLDALGPQFFQPGSPSAPYNDSVGDQPPQGMIPGSPPKQDWAGYANAVAGIDPQKGLAIQSQLAAMQQKQTKVVPEGAAIIGEDGREIFKNPKAEKPKYVAGDIRKLDSGLYTHTQEYDGKHWKTIEKAPRFKPDAPDKPDKPDKPPPGYRFTEDGNLQAIPGGPADHKIGREGEAIANRQRNALARADMVLGYVSKAIEQTGVTSTGLVGAATRKIPQSPALDLNKTIDSIKANIGFSELQAMREASPTGGALGQVAIQELDMLQAVLGSLDTAQSRDQLLGSLKNVEKHFNNWKRAVKQSRLESRPGNRPPDDPLGIRQ